MSATQRLTQKQTQSLALTPQLRQAIKLLELSNLELQNYLSAIVLENPLLSLEEISRDSEGESDENADAGPSHEGNQLEALESPDYENLWTNDDTFRLEDNTYLAPSHEAWGNAFCPDHVSCSTVSLRDHLLSQVNATWDTLQERLIAASLIENLDDKGYLNVSLERIALQLKCEISNVEEILVRLQGFDPTGVFARSPGECISLQLEERGLLDPSVAHFLQHINLFAEGKYERLMKVCGINKGELASILHKIRQCDPRPGLRFENIAASSVIPDVIVWWDSANMRWSVRLNEATLPRLYVDRQTYAKGVTRKEVKKYLQDNMAAANWLLKALEQRTKTIRKVAIAIVEHQQDFLTHGVRFLKPLTLKTIAEMVDMHESSISRSTQNKYMATPRGTFELKYFFTASISAMFSKESLSAESVRHDIAELIASETPDAPWSDDQLVHAMAQRGVDIARRTIAKYREEMGIPSSYLRRKRHMAGFR